MKCSIRKQIEELPELNAKKSRNFGRGYSLAIKDVLEILDREKVTFLVPVDESEDHW